MIGIAIGCIFFVLDGVRLELTNSDGFQNITENFTAEVLGSVAIGIGFSMGSLVHEIDRLSFWLQIMINLAVGLGVYFSVALYLGWIEDVPLTWIILSAGLNILTFFVIGFGHYLFIKREAELINKKLRARDLQ